MARSEAESRFRELNTRLIELGGRCVWEFNLPADQAYYTDPATLMGWMFKNGRLFVIEFHIVSGSWNIYGQITENVEIDATFKALEELIK